MDEGAELAGAMTGAAVGTIAGPIGVAGGAAVGFVAPKVFRRVGAEIRDRLLGPAEQDRIGTVYSLAAREVVERLGGGESFREDGFFETNEDGSNPGAEMLEGRSKRQPIPGNSRNCRFSRISMLRWRSATMLVPGMRALSCSSPRRPRGANYKCWQLFSRTRRALVTRSRRASIHSPPVSRILQARSTSTSTRWDGMSFWALAASTVRARAWTPAFSEAERFIARMRREPREPPSDSSCST